MIRVSRFIAAVVLAFLIIACHETVQQEASEKETKTTDEQQKASSLNPNGDSELALLMRDMYDEAERIKTQIKNGEDFEVKLDHAKILTAHATEPEKASSKKFKDFAKMYLANLDQLKKADSENVEMVFQSLVSSCMSCHQQLCPGPVVRIKKLKLPKKKAEV